MKLRLHELLRNGELTMGDIDKLKVTIDRDECIGDGLCANEAPETFEMDDESKAVVLNASGDDRDSIIEAAKACPVDAIKVVDKDTGEQLVPEE
ncbi:MAG: ferredoxin [Phycisphaerae bacterium]